MLRKINTAMEKSLKKHLICADRDLDSSYLVDSLWRMINNGKEIDELEKAYFEAVADRLKHSDSSFQFNQHQTILK